MLKNKSKLLIICALLLVAIFMLSACDPYATTTFKPLVGDTSGEVVGNGGMAVLKGNYYYYVNGATAKNTDINTFGEVLSGSIARISVADLKTIMTDYFKEVEDKVEKASEHLATAVRTKAQIVVPKIFFSGNTTDTSVNGIFIFNEKLYYSTPNDQKGSNGLTLNAQLCINRCNLDGSATEVLYTLDANTYVGSLMLGKVDGVEKLYYVYVNGGLFAVDLSVKGSKEVKISKTVTDVKFDVANVKVYYENKDNAICSYTIGGEEKVLVAGAKDEKVPANSITHKITHLVNGKVYFTRVYDNDSTNPKNKSLYVVNDKETAGYSLYYVVTSINSVTLYPCDENYLIYAGSQAESGDVIELIKIKISAERTNGGETYLIAPKTNTSAITINSVVGNNLYFTSNSVYQSLDWTVKTSATHESPAPIKYYDTSAVAFYATSWATYDIIGEYVFAFSSTGDIVVISIGKDDLGKDKFQSAVITVTPEPKEEEEK